MSYLNNYAFYEEKHLGVLNDIWNRCEYDRLRSLKPTDVIVDAGASMGAFTVKAALQAKFVYAFEPEPENFHYLKLNTEKLKNVKIAQKALWSQSGISPFFISNNWGGHSLIPKLYGTPIFVEVVTLDDAVKEKIDFLKVDVEATELELFKGATRILQQCKPFIAIEIHNKEIFQSVADFLADFGYTCKHGIIDSTIIDIRQPTYGTVYFEAE